MALQQYIPNVPMSQRLCRSLDRGFLSVMDLPKNSPYIRLYLVQCSSQSSKSQSTMHYVPSVGIYPKK